MPTPGQHFRNPVARQSITFLALPDDPQHHDLVMESTYEPHSLRPPMHYHPFQEELFEVRAGKLTVVLNGVEMHKVAGDAFTVPAGTTHAMWNDGEDAVILRWTVHPALDTPQFMEKIYTLAEQGRVKAGGSLPFLLSMWLMRQYGHVFRPAGIPYVLVSLLAGLLAPLAVLAGYQRNNY